MSEIVWRKSSKSGGNGGQCVEVATLPERVFVRDSKNPESAWLAFSHDEWLAFLDGVAEGEFSGQL